jgi:isocitrate lyase
MTDAQREATPATDFRPFIIADADWSRRRSSRTQA